MTQREGINYGTTGLEIRRPLKFAEWCQLGETLGAMAKSHQWWIGDALVYGEVTFGEERFSQGAESFGLEPHTLVNYRWVASSIAPKRRREELSWSHHAEVARLEPDDQAHMLKRAVDEHLTVRELRVLVAIEYPNAQGRLDLDDDPAGDEDVQHRIEEISSRLEQLGMTAITAEDVAWLLGELRRRTRGALKAAA